MRKTIFLALTLATLSEAHAACLQDSIEIGDIGPSSELVCDQLEERFPHSDIAILDRAIHSRHSVSVSVAINGHLESLEYDLRGADWKLRETDSLASYRDRAMAIVPRE